MSVIIYIVLLNMHGNALVFEQGHAYQDAEACKAKVAYLNKLFQSEMFECLRTEVES